jgi:hypothetical protein
MVDKNKETVVPISPVDNDSHSEVADNSSKRRENMNGSASKEKESKDNEPEMNNSPSREGYSTLAKVITNTGMTKVMSVYGLVALGFILYFTASNNPDIFRLRPDTLAVITQTYNALVLLLVPFVFGCFGAVARVLMAGLKATQSFTLIMASGLMATFSWLGIKSKVFISLLAPYVEKKYSVTESVVMQQQSDLNTEFYSMVLVAVLVGMFASNIYIFINQRVEQLSREASKPNKQDC